MKERIVTCHACGSRVSIVGAEAETPGACPQCAAELEAETPVPDIAAPAPPEPAAPRSIRSLWIAGGAAFVGAVAWALVMRFGNREIGWLAWGIGGLIGWSAVRAGGGGRFVAAGAAALTLLAIFAGKLLGYQLQLYAEADEQAEKQALLYEEYQRDAVEWSELQKEGKLTTAGVREFMAGHGYAEGKAQIGKNEVESFHAYVRPRLEWVAAEKPSREEFRARYRSDLRAAMFAETSLTEIAISDLNGIDLLFAFLGISTAWGLVMRRKGDRATSATA